MATFGPDDAESSAEAERVYNRIRAAGTNDVRAVADNTGLALEDILVTKQHVFFSEHEVFDVEAGNVVKRRFDAQGEIGFAWEVAATRPLVGTEREWFQLFVAHECGERKLMSEGLPFQDLRGWQFIDGEWEHVWSAGLVGAHELAPRPPKFAFPGYDGI